jgi:uncharacterized protein YgbK (DUF1537 family)
MRGVVLADDATGALECGSILASLSIDVSLFRGEGVVVINTATRHASPSDAARCVSDWIDFDGPLFKKTDSTLRGNIGPELTALAARGPVIYIPAYPALGRTVVGGRLLVDGVPVNETAFARDPHQPVRSANIADLFEFDDVTICDASTDDDIAAYAPLFAKAGVVAGPSGVIRHWAAQFDFPTRASRQLPKAESWLIVCGSLHPRSLEQAAAVRDWPVMRPQKSSEELAARVAAADRPDAMLIMGGDTAAAVWRALGIHSLAPLPEVLPGVAASTGGGMLFVTKAGGFGEVTLVEQVIARFR